MHRTSRTRRSSLSISSSVFLGSIFEISKSHSTSVMSMLPHTHEAYGSFIPVRSAACTLQDLAACVSPPIRRTIKRRRKVTFDDKCSYSPSWDDYGSSSSSSRTPHITRSTHHTSPMAPPSPTSTVSSLSPPTSPLLTPTEELHPILARLEERSRLCVKLTQCTTCRKQGSDFPRCPKCGDTWCSRPCRLMGGKRHICPGRL